MTGEFIIFLLIALIAVGGGTLLLNLTKVVHMVIALMFTFVSIAGIYVLLSAEFVAVSQMLVYSGAITIIMLFGIMLTKHNDDSEAPKQPWKKFFILMGIIGFAAALILGIYGLNIPTQESVLHVNNTEQIGIALYSKFIIPFELVSVILLVALIGAIILAKKDDGKEGEQK